MSQRLVETRKRKVIHIRHSRFKPKLTSLSREAVFNDRTFPRNWEMDTLRSKFATTALDSSKNAESDIDSEISHHEYPETPALFSDYPPIRDTLVTKSSELQDDTIKECLKELVNSELELNSYGVPKLRRQQHIAFLTHTLTARYPAAFTAIDASRPWYPYWSLTGLHALGVDIRHYARRVTSTFRTCQNSTGGFGGGQGQTSHIATTYAAVLSLISVSDTASSTIDNSHSTAALDLINRETLWRWLGLMKQPSGGFTMALGGEEDIRGAYCAAVLISLLDLPLLLPPNSPARAVGHATFTDGLGAWVGRCQAFDGGIGGAPSNEAHGAYAFCGLAALCILGPPADTLRKHLDLPALLHWLSSRQHAPEGGFAGRTNKLVDGCYSHWVGGCWALLQVGLAPHEELWSREGLVRYILCCAQTKKGGLRDKPGKPADAYHSCYNLCGLSAAQNVFQYVSPAEKEGVHDEEGEGGKRVGNDLTAGFGWEEVGPADGPFEKTDRVKTLHPVFVIPFEQAQACRKYFETKPVF